MACRFAKVLEEEIEEAFFYPSDLVNTRVGEERWIYTSTLRVSVYIHHYSPPLRGIVVYYSSALKRTVRNYYYYQKSYNSLFLIIILDTAIIIITIQPKR